MTSREVEPPAGRPRVSVSLGLWLDRPADEVLATAEVADACGYPELWIGEMATYDAVGLATAIGLRTGQIDLTLGPLAVAVRDPAGIVMGAGTVAAVTGRKVGVALGTSSPVVVEQWRGRSRARGGTALRESAQVCRQLLDGGRSDLDGEVVRSTGFRLRVPSPGGPLTVAAFGPAAVRAAAEHADRMVINLLAVEEVKDLRGQLDTAVAETRLGDPAAGSGGGVGGPTLAVWVPAAVDPGPAAMAQLRRSLVAYLRAPGYTQMFERAGFGEVVAAAREGASPKALFAAVPDEMAEAIGAIGTVDEVVARIDTYADAGADEVVIVPSATDDDPAGTRTLERIAQRVLRSGSASAPA
jgi:probable F420-dependent oxidoreductase